MKLNQTVNETALRSGFVAPLLGATGVSAQGGVCPQQGAVAGMTAGTSHAPISRTRLDQVALTSAGFAAASDMGPRSWSPPIT